MTLKELKERLPVGAVFTCVENTYIPKYNGQRRMVVKARGNAVAWKPVDAHGSLIGGEDARSTSWTHFPKARDIVKSDAYTVTFKLGIDDHTLTLDLP